MITDKVQWPAKYGTEKADIHVSTQIEVENITSEQVWPNAINLSNWFRYSRGIVDAEFVDSSIEDPHLFKHAEFTIRTDNYIATSIVLTTVEPKGDRPGRLAIESVVHAVNNPDDTMQLVYELVLSVPHDGKTTIESEINAFGQMAKTDTAVVKEKLNELNRQWLIGLIKYTAARSGLTYQQQKAEINGLMGWT
ncbi:MAG: hypothetical protein NC343_08155 [Muribaculum sp.]|nr:hypothetical protein [Muribaculaceae bacterium]MCM1081709.1 hypothetical protein [Muribaculum sp.]